LFRLGVPKGACQVCEFLDDGGDLFPAELGPAVGVLFGWCVLVLLGVSAVGLGFGDPTGDDDDAAVECRPVAGQFRVALREGERPGWRPGPG
jgi:hypothetical protein